MVLSKEALFLVKKGLDSAIKEAEVSLKQASGLVKDNPAKLNEPALEYFKEEEKRYIDVIKELRRSSLIAVIKELRTFRDNLK